MLISHESPLCLLEKSKTFNDYDYALVHLFEKYPQYLNFFEETIKTRVMYLDNSVFELGKAFDSSKFKQWCDHFCNINEENFYYIVPDVLENFKETVSLFNDFDYNRGHRIGVAQGATKDDTIKCFEFMKAHSDVVAISFDYKWFLDYNDNPLGNLTNDFVKFMFARIKFVKELEQLGLLENTKVHLLGCALPQEFSFYKNKNIVSLDTSSPVVHGIKGKKYQPTGLLTKETVKLVDLLEWEGDTALIDYNIKQFRKFAK